MIFLCLAITIRKSPLFDSFRFLLFLLMNSIQPSLLVDSMASRDT